MSAPVKWSARIWVVAALLITAIAASSLGLWLVSARLGGAVMVEGSVRMENTPSPIADTNGGIVAHLAAREGAFLKKGMEILTFDTSELEAERSLIINDLVRATAEYARYSAEANGQNVIAHISLPEDLPESIARNYERQVRTQSAAMRAQYERVAAELAQLQNEAQTSLQQLEALARERNIATSQRDMLAARLEERAALTARGLSTAETQLTLSQNISTIERQIVELEQQSAVLEAKQGAADLKIEQILAGQRQEASERFAQATQEYASLRARLAAIDARIDARVLRAPVDGIVLDLAPRNPGAVIGVGAPILRLIPRDHRRIIEAWIPISKIRHAKLGIGARVYVAGDPERVEYQAEISRISSDRSMDDQGVPYYSAELIFTDSSENLRPGMQVEVALDAAPRRAISYLLEPVLVSLGRSFEHN